MSDTRHGEEHYTGEDKCQDCDGMGGEVREDCGMGCCHNWFMCQSCYGSGKAAKEASK